jgi:hypothetical protein
MCIAHAIQKCAKYCKVLQHRLDILPGQKALIVSSNDCAMATHTAQGLSATIGAMKFGMCGMLKQCMVGDSMLQRPYPPALLKARISCCDYPVKACCSSSLWVLLLNKQPHREARVCGKSTSHKRAQLVCRRQKASDEEPAAAQLLRERHAGGGPAAETVKLLTRPPLGWMEPCTAANVY